MLIDTVCVPVVMGLISEASFYRPEHQAVFASVKSLYDKGKPIDMVTVCETLTSAGRLDEAGGVGAVSALTDGVHSGMNAEYHCRLLIEKQIKREVIRRAQEGLAMAWDETTDALDCVSAMEQSASEVGALASGGGSMRHISDMMEEAETDARRRELLYKEGRCTGVRTGLLELDKRTGGWQRGELIVLAGRPSMGKTALMLHHALSSGVSACIYSLEMSSVSLANRMVLSVADIDAGRFRSGAMSEEDWREFARARRELSGKSVYVDDNAVVTTRYIKSHARMMKDRGRCDVVFVDYLQLTDMRSEQHGRNREQEVSQATREFKIMAKSLDVPVVLLSQLSRECERRPDKKPQLSDLRESGAIEQDADVVVFAYRPAYYGLMDAQGRPQEGIGYEIIAKGRNIGTGEIAFRHNESMTRIWDYSDNEEIPF